MPVSIESRIHPRGVSPYCLYGVFRPGDKGLWKKYVGCTIILTRFQSPLSLTFTGVYTFYWNFSGVITKHRFQRQYRYTLKCFILFYNTFNKLVLIDTSNRVSCSICLIFIYLLNWGVSANFGQIYNL